MMFGRVEAVAELASEPSGSEGVRVTVYLEAHHRIEIVRDEVLPLLRPVDHRTDIAWHADQYAQETIATDLAQQGWEVIAGGDIPDPEPGAMPRSASYALRRIGESGYE